jgi:hypothetical protein
MRIHQNPVWGKRSIGPVRDSLTAAIRDTRSIGKSLKAGLIKEPAQACQAIGILLRALSISIAARRPAEDVHRKVFRRAESARVASYIMATSLGIKRAEVETVLKAIDASWQTKSDRLRNDQTKIAATELQSVFDRIGKEPDVQVREEIESPQGGTQIGESRNDRSGECIPDVVVLPMPCACTHAIRSSQIKDTQSGATLRQSALRSIACGLPVSNPFRARQRQRKGGTILIDASGSMGVSKESLEALCRTAPAATVAYYSGCGSKSEFVIYARGGRRARDIRAPLGGNECDAFALRWLLKQPGNTASKILVSDGGFCSRYDDDSPTAARLLRRLISEGGKQILTIDKAMEVFKRGQV